MEPSPISQHLFTFAIVLVARPEKGGAADAHGTLVAAYPPMGQEVCSDDVSVNKGPSVARGPDIAKVFVEARPGR